MFHFIEPHLLLMELGSGYLLATTEVAEQVR